MKMAGTMLEHVRANVTDLTSAVEWYTKVLGFEEEAYWPPDKPNSRTLRPKEARRSP